MGHGTVYIRYDKIIRFGLYPCRATEYLFANSAQKNNSISCSSSAIVYEYETGYPDIKSAIELTVGEQNEILLKE
jgi:hypothetical protein